MTELEEYNQAVDDGVRKMINEGCKFYVANIAGLNKYDTHYRVSINPESVNPPVAGCHSTDLGKFWRKEYAELFAESLNNKFHNKGE